MYRRQQHIPQTPTLGWYTECVGEILTRLQSQTSARIAVLDIPMIGEDLTSDMNRRVDSYNQALRCAAPPPRMRPATFPCAIASQASCPPHTTPRPAGDDSAR